MSNKISTYDVLVNQISIFLFNTHSNHQIMNRKNRAKVLIVFTVDQRSGKLTYRVVSKFLANSSNHPQGVKVMLSDGQAGRFQEIMR